MCAVATLHRAQVETTIAEMRRRSDESLPLDALAEAAHLSRFHFARVFREVTGVPPGRFLTALRMERAKRLLLTTSLPVTEISLEVGYWSLGTFTRHFTALVGLAPARFRALARSERAAALVRQLREADLDEPLQRGVNGRVRGAGGDRRVVFVGLFEATPPQRRPLTCALVRGDRAYSLGPVPEGRYAVAAASFPPEADLLMYLLPQPQAIRVGGIALEVRGGCADGDAEVVLGPPAPTDPPIVTAIPLLLLERESEALSNAGEANARSSR